MSAPPIGTTRVDAQGRPLQTRYRAAYLRVPLRGAPCPSCGRPADWWLVRDGSVIHGRSVRCLVRGVGQ